jgi:hypothetical protein
VRVTSVGIPVVLNNRPFTDTVLPTASEPIDAGPEKSMKSIPESVTTLIVVTAGFIASEGCKLTPVIIASINSTPTPFGGVLPIVKLMGTPLLGDMCEFIEPPQLANNTQLTTASANKMLPRIGAYFHLSDRLSD